MNGVLGFWGPFNFGFHGIAADEIGAVTIRLFVDTIDQAKVFRCRNFRLCGGFLRRLERRDDGLLLVVRSLIVSLFAEPKSFVKMLFQSGDSPAPIFLCHAAPNTLTSFCAESV